MIDGIKYTKMGDDFFYKQELFKEVELNGYVDINIIGSDKSVYNYILYDSNGEQT